MGEGGAFIAGTLVGGAVAGTIAGTAAYQAGYDQRDTELQPIISSLQNQLNAKEREITELRKQLDEKKAIPVISLVRKKLGGSQS